MSTTEPFPTSLRHRKSVLIPKLDSELELLHTDQQRKTAKQRWSACLAFIFKRSKLKSDAPPSHILSTSSSSLSSLTTSETATLPSDHLHSNDHGDNGNSISEKSTYHYSVSVPPTPVSSLSPPPRHIMTRQNRTKSLTPMDQPISSPPSFSSTPTLPIPSNTVLPPPPPPPPSLKKPTELVPQQQQQQQQRRCIRRSSTLRLSLDVDQRYSYTSSHHSADETHNDNGGIGPPFYDDDTTTTTQHPHHLSFSENASSMTRPQYGYWKEASTRKSATQFTLDSDDDDLLFDDDDAVDDDDDESCSSRQIRKQKAHYDAVVTSTIYHHHRPSQDIIDQPQSPHTNMDPFLGTSPSSAPLLRTPTPLLPSSPHSLASLDTPSIE